MAYQYQRSAKADKNSLIMQRSSFERSGREWDIRNLRTTLFARAAPIALGLIVACCGPAGRAKSPERSEENADGGCHCAPAAEPAGAGLPVQPPTGVPVTNNPLPPSPPAAVPTPLPRVHDPVLAKEGNTYYLFSTGRGITLHTSKDRVIWLRQGRVFADPIPWTAAAIPGSTDHYWAPDISFFNGKWHLYYSVSTFGRNRSAIGLATNKTLDSKRPDYRWKDEGLVVESNPGDNWNAIDPNLALDEKKQPWLSFGSFWGGIKLQKLDAATGKPAKPTDKEPVPAPLYSVSSRPHTGGIAGAVEAPYIVRHGRFCYLFVSFDFCCKGVESTYNIRVGRSAKITGPYVDREGKAMTEGGGTLVRSGSGRWRGPGHNAVYHENNRDWLVYHAYDADDNGVSKLRIEEMAWDAAGWPKMPSP
jgi:arabinan endo-1,5-alpha-L-arabinosidase